MKKLLSVLMVLCMLSSLLLLASCGKGGGGSTKELVNNAIRKTNDLNSYEAAVDMTMSVTMGDPAAGGMQMTMPMTMQVKAKDIKGETPEVYTETTLSMMGQSETAVTYLRGDWVYMLADGEGYKMTPEMAEQMGGAGFDTQDMLEELPEDVLKDVKLTLNSDGSKTVALTLSPEKFMEIYSSFLESAADAELEDVSVSAASIEITVKDGYLSFYRICLTMSVAAEGQTMEIDLDAKASFSNHGGAVTITPPTGYESYPALPLY